MPVPANPKIYHIVHVNNLASIVADGFLWPDSVMAKRADAAVIGNNEIKTDRLRLPVDCHGGTCVGDYVPFYLCLARSCSMSYQSEIIPMSPIETDKGRWCI